MSGSARKTTTAKPVPFEGPLDPDAYGSVPRVNIIRQTIYDENLDSALLDYLNYMLYQASTMASAYDIPQAPPFLFAEMVVLFYRLTPFIQDNAVPAQAWDYLYEEYRMIFGDAGR